MPAWNAGDSLPTSLKTSLLRPHLIAKDLQHQECKYLKKLQHQPGETIQSDHAGTIR